ncbi:MAG TPA: hypothetical protein VHX90_05960 [Verrucomicrobiae bacterium]|jgi:hypothetical protein|nr:hypothetical protein [Verrucomicrobiae bacterium]
MKSRAPTAILIWIWLCAYLNCAGWALSAVHQLNAGGYAVTLLIGFAALLIWRKKNSREGREVCEGGKTGASFSSRPSRDNFCFHKFRRRFRKPFPLAFLILTAMAFLGGAIYAPTNYDGLTYRIPRVLHWLAAGQWHWIHTIFPRVNARACGIEWVSAPIIALTKTDRLLFLINIASFLFLPGLVFSIFMRLGVRRRVAWRWMWIVPTGYCFLVQAGSIGNDLFGAPFVLAAIDFALRAKISKTSRDLFASILAAALMTSAKTSDLPLLLPWATAILPALIIFLRRPLATVGICVIAIFASFLPTAVLNAHFCGDWSGVKLEGDQPHGNVFLRTGANVALVAVQNLTPPIFPLAGAWNHFVQNILPSHLNVQLHQIMTEPEAAGLQVEEMQVEESAGLGFGVTVLFLISIAVTMTKRGGAFWNLRFNSPGTIWQSAVSFAPWISMIALLSQSEVYPIGRILAPYYALLFPFFLVGPAQEQLVKQNWWRLSAFAVFAMAAGLLVVSPARPLFPVGMFFGKIHAAAAQHPLLARAETVYSVYAARSDAFAPAKEILPPGVKILGLITYDDPETSLWRPFGSREIKHVRPDDTAADLKARGVEFILVKGDAFGKWFNGSLDDWLEKMNAQVIQKITLRLRASTPASDWYLVKLD